MDRRTFLTTMLQGTTLAATLLPHSISPLLIKQYASLRHLGGDSYQNVRISTLGINSLGAVFSRLLAYSIQNVCCYEVLSDQLRSGNLDFSSLNRTIQQTDLLFLFADTTDPASDSLLSSCINTTAAAGVQSVVVGPYSTDRPLSALPLTCSTPPHCFVVHHTTARDLVALVADLANTDSFVGIDHGDIKAILRSGNLGLFSCSEATGADRGSRACSQALERLQQQGVNSANCRGAMACIYGSPTMPFDYYAQAVSVMDGYFSNDISFVFGAIPDEHLAADTIKVAILAMR
ncbi:FtsZ/tubulin family protein [Trichlorobacter lovleyi]|uniref:Uncharacterized protein n=1 Tax=Trichlorobacter lovleyi (strain ATCC BAA-1151 / DSM 17278 / SZ) TaxID=398767 RepID=B3E8P6_TRIL1|nr:hypothetical protein [Trichlorobacter lovleyi]ACD93749.1 hypothetical protein Glov_0011 [Trichlorobacter lovleyi SZ]